MTDTIVVRRPENLELEMDSLRKRIEKEYKVNKKIIPLFTVLPFLEKNKKEPSNKMCYDC